MSHCYTRPVSETGSRRILVIGAGYVGLVTAVGMAALGHEVTVVETRPDRLAALHAGRVPIFEAGLQEAFDSAVSHGRLWVAETPGGTPDLVMVCVGTPIGADGRSDLSQLRSALGDVTGILGPGTPLVIRSTLPPGSTRIAVEWARVDRASVFTNPEFLRQGTALEDFMRPTRVVLGHFADAHPAVVARIAELYEPLGAPILVMDVASAEIVKNASNAFLALKLSFANEIASVAEEFGANVDDVLAGITGDPRIGSLYMSPGLGFGGSCLPKELRALAVAGMERGLPMLVTNAASEANAAQMARFAGRIDGVLGGVAGRRIALLGLAFKAGTDDVRDSPPLVVASSLIERGAVVTAYDPQAGANAVARMPALRLADDPMSALEGADVAVIGTEWPAFKTLDWAQVRSIMREPNVVDGRRLLDAQEMRSLGFRYLAVGSAEAALEASSSIRRPS